MHEWIRNSEGWDEGLVCRNCGVTEAEMEASGHAFDRCGADSLSPLPERDLQPGSPEYERGIRLAARALKATVHEDWDAMKAALAEMSGSEALIVAIVALCDTLLARHPDGPRSDGRPVQVAWLEDGKGAVQHAEDVPPPVRWAGQVVAARAALDEDAFHALLEAPAEGADLGSCVVALVQSVAMTLEGTR